MRIGIVGAGDMARTHATCYAHMRGPEGVEIAGIVGRRPGRAKQLAKDLRTSAVASLDMLLEDDSVHAIDVTVPSALHRRIVTPSLRAGKHVFCETPLALTVRDAEAMITEAKKRRRILMVAQVTRFVAAYARLQAKVAAGELGKPRFAAARRLSRPYWLRRPRSFALYGDPIVELMIHDFDVLNWILGMPRALHGAGVVGQSGAIEHAFVSLAYEGSSCALVEGGGMMPDHFPFTTSLQVRGSKGMLDLTQRFAGGAAPKTSFLEYREGHTPKPVSVHGVDPYLEECRYFVRCVRGRAKSGRLRPENDRDALRIAEAARASIARGRTVRLSG